MLKISASVGWISVEVETDGAYPDIADDLTNRARVLLSDGIHHCAKNEWNPMKDAEEETEDEE